MSTVDTKLEAETRSEFGKGAARRIRRADRIPAVLYGHGTDPVHISLPYHQTALLLRQANVLLELIIDGAVPVLALPKQVQRDPVKNVVEHVDLLIVKRGEKVAVDVPVSMVGEPTKDTVAVLDATTLSLLVSATNIPEHIEVSIEGMQAPQQILAGQLELPEGAQLNVDAELMVVNLTAAVEQPTTPDLDAEGGADASAAAEAEAE